LKAVILAAGKGTRLGALTESIPKPLIQIKGKAILQYNIELCKKWGVTEIFINTHHLADKITTAFGDGGFLGVNIKYSFEAEPMGTSGALTNFKSDLRGSDFFVIYGDNYSHYDLGSLVEMNRKYKAIGTIAFHYRDDVTSSGVAEFDKDQKILRFIEKPKLGETQSHWVNAGLYFLTPQVLDLIPPGFSDFGSDIFPAILKKKLPLYGVCSETEVAAFDTPEMYQDSLRKLQNGK
jgi:NDP-sugar pyrophosphorylase family protein